MSAVGDWLFGKDAEQVPLDRDDTQLAFRDTNRKWLREGYHSADDRDAPRAHSTSIGQMQTYGGANINRAPQAQFRQDQRQLVGQLQEQAAGRGPSVSGQQFQIGADANIAQQQALAAGARGGAVGTAARRASQQGTAGIQQAAQGAALGRIQEQQNAINSLGGVLSGARGQDIGLATDQAGLSQQAGLANMGAQNARTMQQAELNQGVRLANLQAQLAQTGMNDAQQRAYMANLLGMDEAELNARMQQDALRVSQRDAGSGGNFGMILGAAAQGAGAAATMSDENQKKDIKKAGSKFDAFLASFGEMNKNQPQHKGRDVGGEIAKGLMGVAGAAGDYRQHRSERANLVAQENAKKQAASDKFHKMEMLKQVEESDTVEAKPFLATPGYAAVSGRPMVSGDISDVRMKTNIQPAGQRVDQFNRGQLQTRPFQAPKPLGMNPGMGAAQRPAQPQAGGNPWGTGVWGGAAAQARPAAKQPPVNTFGAGMGAGGFMSDKDLKHDLNKTESKIDDFLDKLNAYEYEYKEPEKYGEGKRIGIMAQEMERSDLGSEMVHDTENGKMVVPDMNTIFASMARLQERLDELDGKKKKDK